MCDQICDPLDAWIALPRATIEVLDQRYSHEPIARAKPRGQVDNLDCEQRIEGRYCHHDPDTPGVGEPFGLMVLFSMNAISAGRR